MRFLRARWAGLCLIWAAVFVGLFVFMRWHSDRIAEGVQRLYDQEAQDHENRLRGRR